MWVERVIVETGVIVCDAWGCKEEVWECGSSAGEQVAAEESAVVVLWWARRVWVEKRANRISVVNLV